MKHRTPLQRPPSIQVTPEVERLTIKPPAPPPEPSGAARIDDRSFSTTQDQPEPVLAETPVTARLLAACAFAESLRRRGHPLDRVAVHLRLMKFRPDEITNALRITRYRMNK